MMSTPRAALLFAPLLVACQGERPNPHVYASPAPRATAAAGTGAATAPVPEAPLGSQGPGARLTSVLDAVTGAPVALSSATGAVDVMALVALGPGSWQGLRVSMDLAIKGTRDTALVWELGTPAPLMAAHAFRVELGALGPGRYSMRARLLRGGSEVVVESAPLFFQVP